LLNPAISALILARAVEDVRGVSKLNTENRGYVFYPLYLCMNKNEVFAVTASSFNYSFQSASAPHSTEVKGRLFL